MAGGRGKRSAANRGGQGAPPQTSGPARPRPAPHSPHTRGVRVGPVGAGKSRAGLRCAEVKQKRTMAEKRHAESGTGKNGEWEGVASSHTPAFSGRVVALFTHVPPTCRTPPASSTAAPARIVPAPTLWRTTRRATSSARCVWARRDDETEKGKKKQKRIPAAPPPSPPPAAHLQCSLSPFLSLPGMWPGRRRPCHR